MRHIVVDDEIYMLREMAELIKEIRPDDEVVTFQRPDDAVEALKAKRLFPQYNTRPEKFTEKCRGRRNSAAKS